MTQALISETATIATGLLIAGVFLAAGLAFLFRNATEN